MKTSYWCFGVTKAVPIPMQGLSFSSSFYFSCILFITFSNLLHCISSFLSLSFGTSLFSLPRLVFHHLTVLSHFSLLSLHFLFSFFQIRASFSHVRNKGFIFGLVRHVWWYFTFFAQKQTKSFDLFVHKHCLLFVFGLVCRYDDISSHKVRPFCS